MPEYGEQVAENPSSERGEGDEREDHTGWGIHHGPFKLHLGNDAQRNFKMPRRNHSESLHHLPKLMGWKTHRSPICFPIFLA